MFKFIIAALLVISASLAHASQELSMPNQSGGEIRLTTNKCPDKGRETWFIAYAFSGKGNAVYGCWFVNNGLVHVSWPENNNSIYKATDFTPVRGGGI